MVDFFQGGTTYQPGGQVNATNLNALITAAIPINHNRDHFANDSKIVTVAAGKTANPAAGELCWDTQVANLFVYDGSNWVGIGPQQQTVLTAQSSISLNDVVVYDLGAASSVETTTTATSINVAGIARAAAASLASVPVQFTGIGLVNCTSAAVAIGDRLVTSTTAGKARTATSAESNHFAIALSSKSGGAENTVTCSLVSQQVHVPTVSSASFAAYSMTATLTNSTWYDFPNAALGAVTAPTNGGATSMKVSVTSTYAGQPVTLTIFGLDLRTNDANDAFKGFRLVIQNLAASDTVVGGSTTKGAAFTDADGDEENHAFGAMTYRVTSIVVGVSVQGSSVTFTLPTADTYSIRPQFQASNAGATSYTATQFTTATLVAVLH